MFIRFDVIHERDRQTDRRTLGDSKDRAYASHHYHQSELVGDVAVPVSVRQAVLF